jgi:hypothetical protein
MLSAREQVEVLFTLTRDLGFSDLIKAVARRKS